MRIIGGHDYYDSALAYGVDKTIVFVRNKKEDLEASEVKFFRPPSYFDLWDRKSRYGWHKRGSYSNRNNNHFNVTAITIVVAGKRYGVVRIDNVTDSMEIKRSWIHNFETFVEWAQTNYFEFSSWRPSKQKIRNHFEYQASKDEINWLIENRITILTCESDQIWAEDKMFWRVDRDNLKDFQFAKVVDPYTMFQEISMWVSGVLPRDGNPMVTITDDKIKAHKHGFDKWSFRKPPVATSRR
jgi:hypothetical protein